MKITIPESPTLTPLESAECLGNGLLVAIATGGLCYLFEKNAIVPCTLAFLLVSLSCVVWAHCEARGIIHPKKSNYDDDSAYDDESNSELEDESQYPNESEYEETLEETGDITPSPTAFAKGNFIGRFWKSRFSGSSTMSARDINNNPFRTR